MKKIKYVIVALAIGAVNLGQSYTANATSPYDDGYMTTSTLKLQKDNFYGSTCAAIDVSSNWFEYITDRSKFEGTDAEYNAVNVSWQNALDHGGWGVSQQVRKMNNGDPSRHMDTIKIFWTESEGVLNWGTSYAYATSDGVRATFDGVNPIHVVSVEDIGGSCNFRGQHTTTSEVYVSDNIDSNDPYYGNNLSYILSNWEINEPLNYEGNPIVLKSPAGSIVGNVQCANTNNVISAIRINTQSGMSGNAYLTDDGIGGKYYHFNLWEESPYSLVVLCDDDSFYSPTVETNLYDNYNWVCTHTTPGQDPDLNVCAAS